MTNWGAEIKVDGVMPEWLRGEDGKKVDLRTIHSSLLWVEHTHSNASDVTRWHWYSIAAIRLPADHPYYTATNAGFTYWPGGDAAPEDWDGGEVLYRDGIKGDSRGLGNWISDGSNVWNIIGYKRARHIEGIAAHAATVKGDMHTNAILIQPRTMAEWREHIAIHGAWHKWLEHAGLIVEPTDADHARALIEASPYPINCQTLTEQAIAKGRELQKAGK